MNPLNEFIRSEITRHVQQSDGGARYRTPIVGFASAENELFRYFQTLIAADHLLPSDLLKGSRSVVSFFLPFTPELVKKNLSTPEVSKDWSFARIGTDELIAGIIAHMKAELALQGIACSDNPAKEPFDRTRFMHRWSQRHVAYACGLGTFGLNQLLITDSGCAGRLGSFVIDAETDSSTVMVEELCPYKIDQSCGVCVSSCPVGALSPDGINKSACSQWVNEQNEKHFGGIVAFRSCGKCIALPCALRRPRAGNETSRLR